MDNLFVEDVVKTFRIELSQDSEKAVQPTDLKIELMEHQKTAIHSMINLEQTGKRCFSTPFNIFIESSFGILCDRVGAGKSFIIIGLILLNKNIINRDRYLYGSNAICIRTSENKSYNKTTLLIVPHSLITQWITFLNEAPSIKLGKYTNNKDDELTEPVDKYDVILISSKQVKNFFEKHYNVLWLRLIIDEADTIECIGNNCIKTENILFTWYVTATPEKLRQSRKSFIYPYFGNIAPICFYGVQVKNNDEFINGSLIIPRPKRYVIQCLTPSELSIINKLVPPHIIQLINAGNSDQAIYELNCNVGNEQTILTAVTFNIVYNIDQKKKELEEEENEENKLIIQKSIDRLQTRYDTIKSKIYSLNEELCPICMCEFIRPCIVSCCQNMYCFECITLSSVNNENCPHCRKPLIETTMHVVDDGTFKIKNTSKKDKLDTLIELIQSKKDCKMLVFANFSATFYKIQSRLTRERISYKQIKGTIDSITKTIKSFEEGNINVLLLNAKHFGAGINLQMASDIVIFHRFDQQLEEQVIGRAQRLGRKDPLNIYYLLHDTENNQFVDDYDDDEYKN